MKTDSVTDYNTLHSIAFKREILTCTVNWTRIAQMVKFQARDLEVQVSNPGRASYFYLEIWNLKIWCNLQWFYRIHFSLKSLGKIPYFYKTKYLFACRYLLYLTPYVLNHFNTKIVKDIFIPKLTTNNLVQT